MTRRMADRVASFGTSIFTEMSALAIDHGAVNLGQGFPDFAGPQLIKRAAIEAISADRNQYAPAPGLPELRAAIGRTYAESYGLAFNPATEITVTTGATEALVATILALVNPGDEVIIFEPCYDAYIPDIAMAGGTPRGVALQPPVSPADPIWRFDRDELARAFTPRTRLLLLNTPHNPIGKVYDRAELEYIADLCKRHDVIAVVDEVYDRLVFDGTHLPLAAIDGMRDRTVTINSTGKTFSVTGWKIGYTLAAPDLTDAVRRSHQFITFATATPFQVAAAAALDDALHSKYYAELLRFYTTNRQALLDALTAAGLQTFAPQGSYFALTAVPAQWSGDIEFCRYLTTEIGVAAIPVSVFYREPGMGAQFARFCFAKQPATLRAAAERLGALAVQRGSVGAS